MPSDKEFADGKVVDVDAAETTRTKVSSNGSNSAKLYDKTLSTASNLARLLPTGTTTAFQTLAPSFTNHGDCLPVNRYFTWALIGFLGLLCALISFTDSITDHHGHTHYGLVTLWGFKPFNPDDDDHPIDEARSKKLAMKWRDLLHSSLRFAVFISLSFCDSGVQRCLVPAESRQWREVLVNMPLAWGFLASFVFMVFPSTRHGIGAGPAAATLDDNTTNDVDNAAVQTSSNSTAAHLVSRVAPSTSYELDDIVV